jgi:hypothetical protein
MAADAFPNADPSPGVLAYPGWSMRSDTHRRANTGRRCGALSCSAPAFRPRRRAPTRSGPVAGTSSAQQSYPTRPHDRCPAGPRRQAMSSNPSGGGPARKSLGRSRRKPSNVPPVALGSRIDAIKRSRGFAERTTRCQPTGM